MKRLPGDSRPRIVHVIDSMTKHDLASAVATDELCAHIYPTGTRCAVPRSIHRAKGNCTYAHDFVT